MSARLSALLQFINNHLDQTLTTSQLAQVAHWSADHVQRQFKQSCGIGLRAYLHQAKLALASRQLVYRAQLSVLDIALNCGFQSREAFSRMFKSALLQSPSDFRKHPNWQQLNQHCRDYFQLNAKWLGQSKPNSHSAAFTEPLYLAVMPATAQSSLYEVLRGFIDWRKSQGLPPTQFRTFNLWHFNEQTQQAQIAVAVALPPEHPAWQQLLPQMQQLRIASGHYQQVPVTGSDADLAAMMQHYSPLMADSTPPFWLVERHQWFPDVPYHQQQFTLYAQPNDASQTDR